jgi:hypothetical protein
MIAVHCLGRRCGVAPVLVEAQEGWRDKMGREGKIKGVALTNP